MDILQDTLCVIRWLNTQVFTIFSVPQIWQGFNRDFAVDERLLQFKAENDVQVVGDFIGLGTNETRLDFIECTYKIDDIYVLELLREALLDNCKLPPLPERQRAA